MKANTTFGTAWMHNHLVSILRYVDVRLLYAFTAVFVIPVCLIINKSRVTAYRYFRERRGYSKLHAAWSTYVNHCLFGQTVIDRFAMFAGKRFKVTVKGYKDFSCLADKDEGFMMLSAHVGCYEIAGYTLVADKKRVNALVYGSEKATVMNGRKEIFDHTNIRMIPVEHDMSHLFKINEALSNNEIVSMPADRVIGSHKVLEAMFIGKKAKLPMGPFSVATMRGMEVIAVNVFKTSAMGYTVYVSSLKYDKTVSRNTQMQQLADSYAKELEKRLEQYPQQWYNFYDFWA